MSWSSIYTDHSTLESLVDAYRVRSSPAILGLSEAEQETAKAEGKGQSEQAPSDGILCTTTVQTSTPSTTAAVLSSYPWVTQSSPALSHPSDEKDTSGMDEDETSGNSPASELSPLDVKQSWESAPSTPAHETKPLFVHDEDEKGPELPRRRSTMPNLQRRPTPPTPEFLHRVSTAPDLLGLGELSSDEEESGDTWSSDQGFEGFSYLPSSTTMYSLRRYASDTEFGNFTVNSSFRSAGRRKSLSEFHRSPTAGLLALPTKAAPADVATTLVDVHGSRAVDLVSCTWDTSSSSAKSSMRTAQSVRSNGGTFECVWEEAPSGINTQSNSSVELSDDASVIRTPPLSVRSGDKANVALDKVTTKLAGWSWANGKLQEDLACRDSTRHSCSEDTVRPRFVRTGEEEVLGPPNTQHASESSSDTRSKHHSRRSSNDAEIDSLPSTSSSPALMMAPPPPLIREPSHLTVPATRVFSFVPIPDPQVSLLTKQLSNLAAEDVTFQRHRDSVDLARQRLPASLGDRVNPQLTSTRDSIVLARTRFEKYPKSMLVVEPATGRQTFGGLSPIMDASPPDVQGFLDARRVGSLGKSPLSKPQVQSAPDLQHIQGTIGESTETVKAKGPEKGKAKKKALVVAG